MEANDNESVPDDKIDAWKEQTVRDLKRKGLKKIVHEPDHRRIRFNSGDGGDQFVYYFEEPRLRDSMAHMTDDELLPWIENEAERLANWKPKWEAARLPCEENYAKSEDERDKNVAPPGEIEEGLDRIEEISSIINQLPSDQSLTPEQKRLMVRVFGAGMNYRTFLNLTARRKLRSFRRDGEKRPPSKLTHWKKRLLKHLQTLEERPTPTKVVNLCEDFTKAGKKISEGVRCGGEIVLRDTFEKEIKRRWKQIQRQGLR